MDTTCCSITSARLVLPITVRVQGEDSEVRPVDLVFRAYEHGQIWVVRGKSVQYWALTRELT